MSPVFGEILCIIHNEKTREYMYKTIGNEKAWFIAMKLVWDLN